jgi:copper chaperone
MLTFKITDMTCGHCAGLINRSVKAIDPESRITFILEQQLMCVASANAGTEEILDAIAEAGYSGTLAGP